MSTEQQAIVSELRADFRELRAAVTEQAREIIAQIERDTTEITGELDKYCIELLDCRNTLRQLKG